MNEWMNEWMHEWMNEWMTRSPLHSYHSMHSYLLTLGDYGGPAHTVVSIFIYRRRLLQIITLRVTTHQSSFLPSFCNRSRSIDETFVHYQCPFMSPLSSKAAGEGCGGAASTLIHPSIYVSYLLVYLSIYLSIHPSIHLSIYLSTCLSICLSIHPFIPVSSCLSIAAPSASVTDQIIHSTPYLHCRFLLLFIIIIIIIITLIPATASLSMLQVVYADRASVCPRRWAVDPSRALYSIRGAVAAIVIVVPAVAVASSQSHPIIKAPPTPMPTVASLQLLVSDYRRVYHIHRRPSLLSSTHQRTIQWWPGPASAAPSPAMSTAQATWVLRW